MTDPNKDLFVEERIDSVKEVSMNIRDHRADEDFEKMLAELNTKMSRKSKTAAPDPQPEQKPSSRTESAAKTETMSAEPAAGGERKAVAAMSAAVAAPPVRAARSSAPKKRKRPHSAERTASAVSEKIDPHKSAETAKPERKMISEPPKNEFSDVLGNISEVWNNPNLSEGGRVSMNIKTELRKEIKITVPPEVIQREQAKKNAELAVQAKRDAAVRAEMQKSAESVLRAREEAIEKKKADALKKQKEAAAAKAQITAKRFAVVNSVVCFTAFFAIGFSLLVCRRESGFIRSENRNLAEKPELTVSSLLDGSYFEDLTEWYTDTIPVREQLKPFSSTFSKLFGVNVDGVKITGDISPVNKEVFDESLNGNSEEVKVNTDFTDYDTSADRKDHNGEQLAEVPENLGDGEWIGSVVVAGSGENVRAMSAFNGTFAMGKKYAETVNKYREDLGSMVNIYTMNIPISSAYYMPENLADEFTSQHDCIKNIGSELHGIINVDVYDALEEHKSEYIYSRTDHHWTPLGAYYAAKVFADYAQVDFAELDTYEEYRIEDFVGTMYAYSDYDDEIANNPDTFIYYKPDNEYTVTYYDESFGNPYEGSLFFDYAEGVNCYSAILGTDDIIAEIETDCDNGRTLVVIKDSFGNALVPFLTGSFSKIYVCDLRYLDINAIDFCEQVGCTDLLFAVSITASHTESHINTLGNDRIQ